MAPPDYYKILGITEHASIEKIKAAFRRLALKYHPDKNPLDQKALLKFTRILKAYEVLSNTNTRRAYDQARVYRLSKLAASFSFRPVLDNNKIRLLIEKRVALLGELIPVTVYVFDAGKDFRVKGLQEFEIVEGPDVSSFSSASENKPLLKINYLLRPKGKGYFEIGPASFISNGNKYLSDSVHIKVNYPPTQIRYRPASRFEKAQSFFTSVLLIAYSLLIGYNVYTYDIWPRIKPPYHSQLEYLDRPVAATPLNDRHLITGVSPYKDYFGQGVYDSSSFNELRFANGKKHDAIVCLTEYETGKTIRNNYIQAGHNFAMLNIPDGSYFLKVLFGNDWNPDKCMLNDQIKGSFNRNVRFELFHQEVNILDMHQSRDGDTLNFKIYEITLYPVRDGNTKSLISGDEKFFN